MWFFIALLGYFFLALVFILDKFILTKSVSKPVVYTFYSTIFMFGALLAWPLGVEFLNGVDWLWAIVSGVTFGFGFWTLFIAVKSGEASHINPFSGAVVTIGTYLFSFYFLGEELSQLQLVGMIILVLASFLLSFEKSKKNNGFHAGFLWAVLSGLFFAASHVSAKYLYDVYPFLTGFIWTRASTGLVGLITLLYPSVRKSLFGDNKKLVKTRAKRYAAPIVAVNKVLGVVAVVLIQYAAAIGSVSLVMAMSGLQFAMMFFLIFVLTKFLPRFFNEYFTKRELVVEMIAIVLVVFGSALFVI